MQENVACLREILGTPSPIGRSGNKGGICANPCAKPLAEEHPHHVVALHIALPVSCWVWNDCWLLSFTVF